MKALGETCEEADRRLATAGNALKYETTCAASGAG